MAPAPEIADDVRDLLPPFRVEEAIQARGREDVLCPFCNRRVSAEEDASLLVMNGLTARIAVAHRPCGHSQVLDFDSGGGTLLADDFALGWHATLRAARPRAVLIWENKTNFDDWDDDETGSEAATLEIFNFERAEGSIDSIAPPRAEYINAVGRDDELELHFGQSPDRHVAKRLSDAWRIQAEDDGEILALYGTALKLDDYDDDHLARRMEAGKVVAAVLAFRQEQPALHRDGPQPRFSLYSKISKSPFN